MKKIFISGLLLFFHCLVYSTPQIIEVDFLEKTNLEINGAGPILVKSDLQRNRIILINTYTSSVSIIDENTQKVENIPITKRIPQYLKASALAIHEKTGNIYVIGEKSLHIVSPEDHNSVSVITRKQYEMVAVDENSGNAFLVGREDQNIGFFNIKSGKLKYIKCFDIEEQLINLNATPPPSIRKVVCNPMLEKIFIIDGITSTLYTCSSNTGKILSKRKMHVSQGSRWHFAGYNSKTNFIFSVIETDDRKVVQAVKIDVLGTDDQIIDLPGLTEGVGIIYNEASDQVIIPYDNHPVVHVVDFTNHGEISEIKIPAYGNDASAIDEESQTLYLASWAYGEIDVIDLENKKLVRRVKNAGILPHMFSMALNLSREKLYVPVGATAVNGSHGVGLTVFDINNDYQKSKIYTGWPPVDLIQIKGSDRFLVFNSEDEFAEVSPDGSYKTHKLPYAFPRSVIYSDKGNIFLSYGPHQSYWPSVYIWAAKNGIMEIESKKLDLTGEEPYFNFQIFDRRIPRLAQGIVLDEAGALYALQNSWGKEKQFLTVFEQGIRIFAPQTRIVFEEIIQRETIPRILKYDEKDGKLYVVNIGEKETDNGKLLILDAESKMCEQVIETGITPTDLVYDSSHIYITNFDSNSITAIDKKTHTVSTLKTGEKPIKLAMAGQALFVINHNDNTLQRFGDRKRTYKIKFQGTPDNLYYSGETLIITSHNPNKLAVLSFDPETEKFTALLQKAYPYGETSFDTGNSSFFTRGQFGDSIFSITKIKQDDDKRLWITDFLSGKLFIINRTEWLGSIPHSLE